MAARWAAGSWPVRVDDTGRVGAQNPGRRNRYTGQPADDEEVEMIECGRLNADAYVGRGGEHGHRQIGSKFEPLHAAVRADRESSHWCRGKLYCHHSVEYAPASSAPGSLARSESHNDMPRYA